jgi:predicted transcriptional regulator
MEKSGKFRSAKLSHGYSRLEDYKAKTAAVAEERRQVEAERSSLDTTLKAQYANQLEEATNLLPSSIPCLQKRATSTGMP